MSTSINPPPQKSVSRRSVLTPAQRTLLADVYLLLLKRRTQRQLNQKAAAPEKFGDRPGATAVKAVSAKADTTSQCSAASPAMQVGEANDAE